MTRIELGYMRLKGVPVGKKVIIVALLLLLGCAGANKTAFGEDEIPKIQKKNIAQLIQQLGNDDWEMRESAQRELIKIGEPAISFVERALKESDDAEVRLRARDIIISINVQRLHRTWKESWYSITAKGPNQEPRKIGYSSVKLKEAQYEGQDVFVIQEHYKLIETPELKVETYCTKDRNLSFVYIKLILDDTQKRLVSEFKFKNGKITDYKLPPRDDDQDAKHGETREEMAFPTITWPSALFPLLTAIPLYENTTFNFKSRNAVISSLALIHWELKEEQKIVTDYQVEFVNREDLKIGKEVISAYKFKEPKENEFVPLMYYWVNSKDRRLIKASLIYEKNEISDDEGELEFILTTKKEALEGWQKSKEWWEKNKDKFQEKE